MSEKWTVRHHDRSVRQLRTGFRLSRAAARLGIASVALAIAAPISATTPPDAPAIPGAESSYRSGQDNRLRPATNPPGLGDMPSGPVSPLQGRRIELSSNEVRRDWTPAQFSAASPSLGPAALRAFTPNGFSHELLVRMTREANYDRRRTAQSSPPTWGNFEDSAIEKQRADHAERIVIRSFKRTFKSQLEQLARATSGLGTAIDWVEGWGRSPAEDNSDPAASGTTGERRFDTRIGLRIGMHPRMTVNTRFFKFRGLVELPLRREPLRISVEHDLGRRSRIALSGGLSSGQDDWARLTFRVGF